MAGFARILVGTDFGEASDAAVNCARVLAWTFGASLALVHVVEDVEADLLMAGGSIALSEARQSKTNAEARARLAAVAATVRQEGLEPTTALLVGEPAQEVLQYAADHLCDLIVVGTHGRRGVGRLIFGSVAESIVRGAPCPVLTLRACRHAVAQA